MKTGGKIDARSKRPIAIAEEDRYGIGVVIDYCQVELAVAVEITDGDVARIRAYRVGGRRLERSVAISRQHRDCVTDGCAARTIGHHEIELAIAIEIGCGNATRGSACCAHGPSAEGTVAIAQVKSDDIVKDAGDRQIEAAVAIEVADHGVRGEAASSAQSHCRLQRPVAIAEEDRHSPTTFINDGDIKLAVAIEIADGNEVRIAAGGVLDLRCKRNVRSVGDDEALINIGRCTVVAIAGLRRTDRASPYRNQRHRVPAHRAHCACQRRETHR